MPQNKEKAEMKIQTKMLLTKIVSLFKLSQSETVSLAQRAGETVSVFPEPDDTSNIFSL